MASGLSSLSLMGRYFAPGPGIQADGRLQIGLAFAVVSQPQVRARVPRRTSVLSRSADREVEVGDGLGVPLQRGQTGGPVDARGDLLGIESG